MEQVDKAKKELGDDTLDRHETIHQVRKRCKKIRGLLRLARPHCESWYQRENKYFGNASRLSAHLRDTRTMVATYDSLMDHFVD